MTLNSSQKTAVETLSGPLLVLAGAGTGKTRVVTYRIVRLIESGIRASRILAVTFTNKAAREMQSRVTELLTKTRRVNNRDKPEISTFHSLCVRILRRHITRLGYPQQFAIYDRSDQESVARQVLNEIKVSSAAMKPSDLLYQISQWKCAALRPDQAAAHVWSAKDHLALLAYERYQKTLKTLGAVDFDDLLLLTEELFQTCPDVLATESNRFEHLLIDEYQDTNMSQYRIVKGLAMKHRNICVVGDDDQAIYGWRGAEVTHILGFRNDWADAKVVRLEENYRSTKPILDWANRVISFNATRHEKQLRTTRQGEPPRIIQCKDGDEEAKTVVEQIKTRIGNTQRQPCDFAILYRTNEQPRAFEMELRNANIPYTIVGGQSFFDRKEVRDVLAYLKTVNHPQDEISLLRILNMPPRGIGQTSVQKILESAVNEKISVWDKIGSIVRGESTVESLTPKVRDALTRFQSTITGIQNSFKRSFDAETVSGMLDTIAYQAEITRQYADPNERSTRWESVGEVVNAVASYVGEQENASLQGFLDSTSLAEPDFSNNNKKDAYRNNVTMMTLHAAKGLEFKEVYLIGMEEGILPHHRSLSSEDTSAIDEERRLCYVGITRAELRLTLTMALNRMKWGKPKPTMPSRFLYEITGQAQHPNYHKVINGKLHEGKK
ncbi:MAG: UvrD-helicase domain-containing protein [Planctomycetaceae bacterium]|jgi:DNA helicase-2/ATP-dependent DNA helicase PcrA|nr:UvrD-helicase domain-containing protein [Planctomycetaceae bacterium]